MLGIYTTLGNRWYTGSSSAVRLITPTDPHTPLLTIARIIQDGNYDDFQVGASYKLALEFNSSAARPSSTHVMQCERKHASVYNVVAKVIFATPKVWVIDFGARVYCETRPPRFVRSGDWRHIGRLSEWRIRVQPV